MIECKPIILLNNSCNFRCCHCYVANGDRELPIEYIKQYYENVMKPNNADFVRFAGGEPFMYSKFNELAELLYSIHSENSNIQFNFTTNGSTVTDNRIEELKLIQPNLVKVSLLSLREEKYEEINGVNFPLKKVLQNVEKLRKHFDVGINMTIMKDTLCDVEPLINYCLENGIKDLFFSQLTPAGRGYDISDKKLDNSEIKSVKELINSIDRSRLNIRYDDGCSCGFYEDFVLNWDGDVFPCTALVSYPEYSIGKYDSNVEIMRENISNLKEERHKVCFVEEFVTDNRGRSRSRSIKK